MPGYRLMAVKAIMYVNTQRSPDGCRLMAIQSLLKTAGSTALVCTTVREQETLGIAEGGRVAEQTKLVQSLPDLGTNLSRAGIIAIDLLRSHAADNFLITPIGFALHSSR